MRRDEVEMQVLAYVCLFPDELDVWAIWENLGCPALWALDALHRLKQKARVLAEIRDCTEYLRPTHRGELAFQRWSARKLAYEAVRATQKPGPVEGEIVRGLQG